MRKSQKSKESKPDSIFRELGFSETESRNLLLRSQLMLATRKAITAKGLSQSEAAKILEVGQPRLSNLYNGKIDRFTIDALVNFLSRLDKKVKIVVE
ncbi:MAG: helix-turn-helix transcriptional regulator [Candidatus Melainabacteria bacterium]|nr:helix-turn-helix transcriptional regulator [Candidatus Melainabacteria bacterium]